MLFRSRVGRGLHRLDDVHSHTLGAVRHRQIGPAAVRSGVLVRRPDHADAIGQTLRGMNRRGVLGQITRRTCSRARIGDGSRRRLLEAVFKF